MALTPISIKVADPGETLDCLAVSPDGQSVAVGLDKNRIIVIDKDRRKKASLVFQHAIENLAIANGATIIASGMSCQYTIRRKECGSFHILTKKWVMGVTISADGARVAVGTEGGCIFVREYNEGLKKYCRGEDYPKLSSNISSVALNMKGDMLAVGTRDGDVHLVDVCAKTILSTYKVEDEIVSMKLSCHNVIAARGLSHSYLFQAEKPLVVKHAAVSDGSDFAVIGKWGASVVDGEGRRSPISLEAKKVSLSADGKYCATTRREGIDLWTTEGVMIGMVLTLDEPASMVFADLTLFWTDSSPNLHFITFLRPL